LTVVLGCSDPAVDGRPERGRDAAQHGSQVERKARDLERLRTLGYIEFPEDDSPTGRLGSKERGLVQHDSPRVARGFVLINPISEARAYLVNRLGVVKHTWSDPSFEKWTRTELQPNGDLLVVGRIGETKVLSRYSWSSDRLWQRDLDAHHDLDASEAGEILVLGSRNRQVDGVRIFDQTLLHLTGTGQLLHTVSIYDLLNSSPELYDLPLESEHPAHRMEGGRLDLLHVNSVAWMPHTELESLGDLYRPSCVLLSVRHQHLAAIVDLESETLLWAWGPGNIQFPHEATWLENGNVLLFDNGTEKRGHSRIVEVDPRTDQVVWQYRGDPPSSFFSKARGTAQALPNGNVLIASTNQGEVFEVTREGDVVWRYVLRDDEGRRLAPRALHYRRGFVTPFLTPGSDR